MAFGGQWTGNGANLGDVVLIADESRLRQVLDEFCPTLDCILPLTVEEIALQYGTIVDLKRFSDSDSEHSTFAILLLENGSDVALPLAAFEVIQMEILEASDEDPYAKLHKRDQQLSAALKGMASLGAVQEEEVVRELAAECIQSAFRRHRECKQEKLLRKKKSVEKMVQNMAAETITKSLRRMVSNGSLRRIRSSDISVQSNASQTMATSSVHSIGPHSESIPSPSFGVPVIEPKGLSSPSRLHPPASSPSAVALSDIRLQSLPAAITSQTNNIYFVCEVNSWAHRSATQYNAGSSAEWKGPAVYLPVPTNPSAIVRFFIFHECEVLSDKLLGSFEIPVSSILTEEAMSYSATIYDSSNITKRKAKGEARLQHQAVFDRSPDEANFSTQSPRNLLEDCSVKSAESRYVSIPTGTNVEQPTVHHLKDVKLTSSQLVHASNILRQHEVGDHAEEVSAVTVTARTTLSDPILPPPSVPKPVISAVKEPTVMNTGNKAETKAREPVRRKSIAATRPSVQKARFSQQDTAPPPPQDNKPPPMRRQSISSTIPSSSSAGPKSLVDQIMAGHAIDYVFDHAFRLALQDVAPHLCLRTDELMVLLDALNILPKSSAQDMDSNYAISVPVPITCAAAFAAALAEAYSQLHSVQNNSAGRSTTRPGDEQDYLVPNAESIPSLVLSEAQAAMGVQQLTQLISGPYINIRGMVFLACCTASRNQSTTAAGIGAEGAVTPETRPSRLTGKWVERLLVTMGLLEPQQKDSGSTSPTPKGLLERSDSDLGRELKLKSSLLKARLSVYRRCLMRLDRYWQRGLRPNDRLQQSSSGGTTSSIGVKDIVEWIDRGLEDSHDDFTVTSQSVQGRAAAKSLALQATNDVVNAYSAISRAYSWGLTAVDVSALAHLLGGVSLFVVRVTSEDEEVRSIAARPCEEEVRWAEVRCSTRDKMRRLRAAIPSHTLGTFEPSQSPQPSHVELAVEVGNRFFIKVPRSCSHTVGPTSSSAALTASARNPFLANDQVSVGMPISTLPQPFLQRIYNAVIEKWWERPPGKQIQAMAGQAGAVVSVADLASRGLVGVRILKGDMCDAIPIEGLMRAKSNDAGNKGGGLGATVGVNEDSGGIRRLLQLKRRGTKKKDKLNRKRDKSGAGKSALEDPLGTNKDPTDDKSDGENRVLEDHLSLQSFEPPPPAPSSDNPSIRPSDPTSANQTSAPANTITVTVTTTASATREQSAEANQAKANGSARPRSAPSVNPANDSSRRPSTVGSTTRKSKVALPTAAILEEEKDYGWLKLAKSSTHPHAAISAVEPHDVFAHPHAGDEAPPPPLADEEEVHASRDEEEGTGGGRKQLQQRLRATALHRWEIDFDPNTAQYAAGMHAPSPPRSSSPTSPSALPLREGEVRISSPKPLHWPTGKGGAGHHPSKPVSNTNAPPPWRPSSANPVTPLENVPPVEETIPAKARKQPTEPGAVLLAVSGAAYKQGGVVHDVPAPAQQLVNEEPTLPKRKKKSKPRKVYQNFFDAQTQQIDQAAVASQGNESNGWTVQGSNMPLAPSTTHAGTRGRSKSPPKPQPPTAHALPSNTEGDRLETMQLDDELVLSEEGDQAEEHDRDIRFSVEVTSPRLRQAKEETAGTAPKARSLREELHFKRETARSARELSLKEKVLQRELKRLGVRTGQI